MSTSIGNRSRTSPNTDTAGHHGDEISHKEVDQAKCEKVLLFILGGGWIFFQFYIIFYPLLPMVQRPLHVVFAIAIIFLSKPLKAGHHSRSLYRLVDLCCVAIALSIGAYFVFHSERILTRIFFVDAILPSDMVFCVLLVILLIEATRRTVGFSLLIVAIGFLVYGCFGDLFPGWLHFRGIRLAEYTEVLFLVDSGIFGIPVEASLHYVFYFVVFGAIFAAIGGSRLFIDLGFRLSQKQKGGSAKAAVIASSAMGTISGAALANVTTTGVFTIPFMIDAGYDRETAGATEAIASTGGQLMPPIMGIGAFIMAEFLGISYLRVAAAAMIPAILFYLSLFLLIDFRARRTGIGGIIAQADVSAISFVSRIHLFIPVIVLVWVIIIGHSPTMAAFWGCVTAVAVSFLRKDTRPSFLQFVDIIGSVGRQAAGVTIPIAAIGIIIAVAMHSNLTIKFSTRLMEISGGSLVASLFFIIIGCIILGMGVPTVAAYIMGAVFFAPPLIKLGIEPLAAHLFVFYFSILALVTPPVALVSFAAAGLAKANITRTGIKAFVMSLVAFGIPLVFIFDTSLLCFGSIKQILITTLITGFGVMVWSAALAGFFMRNLSIPERWVFAILSAALLWPHRGFFWIVTFLVTLAFILWITVIEPRFNIKKVSKKMGHNT